MPLWYSYTNCAVDILYFSSSLVPLCLSGSTIGASNVRFRAHTLPYIVYTHLRYEIRIIAGLIVFYTRMATVYDSAGTANDASNIIR